MAHSVTFSRMPKLCNLLFVFLLMALFVKSVWAQETAVPGTTSTDTMALGNRLYENGRFAEAAQTYQQLVDQGVYDAALFYNLGNAAYRSGDLGQAILSYERAVRLAPRDADARYNLEIARSQIADQFTESETAVARLTLFARSWLTLNEMAGLLLALWIVMIGVLLLRSYVPARLRVVWRVVWGVTAVFWLGGMLSLGSRLYLEQTRPEAIVLADSIAVLSSPDDSGIDEFTLHAGAKISLIETREGWIRLALPGGQLQGWVSADAIDRVTR